MVFKQELMNDIVQLKVIQVFLSIVFSGLKPINFHYKKLINFCVRISMPSLIRIVLIDTHLPGVVELELDGHTNICGTNASGKTTLQRLVPVFYGEYPSRVVPSTRDSFERWYLPHDGSYIIYEYQKSDGLLYQAVLSSAGDGKGVNYRFVAKGFELEDYVKNPKR